MFRFKMMIVLGLSIAICIHTTRARPQNNDVEVIRNESDVRPDGYNFAYETSDGTKHEQTAFPNDDGSLSVEGSFSFVGDDGVTYTVNFVADEEGFRAEGDHIPQVDDSNLLRADFDNENDPQIADLPPSAVLSLVGG